MSSEPSAYRCVGLDAHEVSHQPKRKMVKQVGRGSPVVHRFGYQFKSVKYGERRDLVPCMKCGKAAFLVEWKDCKGGV